MATNYKEEVLKVYPDAAILGGSNNRAIYAKVKGKICRISGRFYKTYQNAAWESAYNTNIKNKQND